MGVGNVEGCQHHFLPIPLAFPGVAVVVPLSGAGMIFHYWKCYGIKVIRSSWGSEQNWSSFQGYRFRMMWSSAASARCLPFASGLHLGSWGSR